MRERLGLRGKYVQVHSKLYLNIRNKKGGCVGNSFCYSALWVMLPKVVFTSGKEDSEGLLG